MSLSTSRYSVEKLQSSLQAKAKSEPNYRFYSLWDKICRSDVLREAYRRSRANAGAPGVDAVDFQAIEVQGVEQWLGTLQQELRSKAYAPQPLLRVWIPKRNGGQRPLSIPTVSANYPGPHRVFGMGRSSTSFPPPERPTFPGP
jgi:retron-type reverse transcriptase